MDGEFLLDGACCQLSPALWMLLVVVCGGVFLSGLCVLSLLCVSFLKTQLYRKWTEDHDSKERRLSGNKVCCVQRAEDG